MKIRIIIFMLLLYAIGVASKAQSPYYYYGRDKIFMEADHDKVGVLIPNGKERSVMRLDAIESVILPFETNSISNSRYRISFVDLKDFNKENKSDKISALKKAVEKYGALVYPSYKTGGTNEMYMTNYVNVRVKKAEDKILLDSIACVYDLEMVCGYELMPMWYTLSVTENTEKSTLDVANEIFETGLFASSYPDFTIPKGLIKNSITDKFPKVDPYFYEQWGLFNKDYPNTDISAMSAWKLATGKGVNIAILDTGIDMEHEDLKENIFHLSFDTETQTSPSKVYSEHGTHCAGIAAAARNDKGIVGVAPDAKLMSISALIDSGDNISIKLATGFIWAWKNGADIVSCSWSRIYPSDAIKEAMDSVLFRGRNGKGMIITNSSGNDDADITGVVVNFPGNYRPEILLVGSIDCDGVLSDFSIDGPEVDICAPGSEILSTMPGNQYGLESGTSMSCACVAGVAALILDANPQLTGQDVRDIIEKTAKKVGDGEYVRNLDRPNGIWNVEYGYGLVDAYSAVKMALDTKVYADKTVRYDTIIEGDRISVRNVTVENGAKLTLDAATETVVNDGFEMGSGTELEIK